VHGDGHLSDPSLLEMLSPPDACFPKPLEVLPQEPCHCIVGKVEARGKGWLGHQQSAATLSSPLSQVGFP
jgi:hypothetical protein